MSIQGQVRQPRGAVKIGGTLMPGLMAWTWDGNSLLSADTFDVTFVLSALPDANNAAWWAVQINLTVELFVGFPGSANAIGTEGLTSVFSGVADEVSINWDAGTLTVRGRDLTSLFLDNKTSEKFINRTSSQIATTLATRRGLTPVITSTSTLVGKYYKTDHTKLADDRNEWELLVYLARQEGFVVYVKANELHFEPPPTAGNYNVSWVAGSRSKTPSGSMVSMTTSRVLTVARDMSVTVNSWNSKAKKSYSRKASRSGKGGGKVQQYVKVIPNLQPDEAQQRAAAILAELSRHEMRLSMHGPADNLLTKASLISFSGTGTAFDQTYYPDTIARTFSASGGYTFQVSAKNHTTGSEPNL